MDKHLQCDVLDSHRYLSKSVHFTYLPFSVLIILMFQTRKGVMLVLRDMQVQDRDLNSRSPSWHLRYQPQRAPPPHSPSFHCAGLPIDSPNIPCTFSYSIFISRLLSIQKTSFIAVKRTANPIEAAPHDQGRSLSDKALYYLIATSIAYISRAQSVFGRFTHCRAGCGWYTEVTALLYALQWLRRTAKASRKSSHADTRPGRHWGPDHIRSSKNAYISTRGGTMPRK